MTNLWQWLLRRGMRNGFDRGVVGGSPLWLVLGGLALLGHLAARAMPRHEALVFSTDIEPGDVFEITSPRR
jgi:hypothetical protein